jgi:hypothetical protein
MRRIVFSIGTVVLIISVIAPVSCTSSKVDPPGPEPERREIALRIYVPKPEVATYVGEDASIAENHIDTLYIDLKQAGVVIHSEKLSGGRLKTEPGSNDSIVYTGFEVDNITTGPLTAEVHANRNYIRPVMTEIPLPDTSDPATLFMMSGSTGLSYEESAYRGAVYPVRNVAKLRIRISKHPACLPSDLVIDYDNIRIRARNVPNQTTLFGPGDATGQTGFAYITYPERTGTELRKASGFSPTGGGQIDSLYLNENYLSNEANYDDSNKTCIRITVPTASPTGGAKTDAYEYAVYTNGSYRILRNYIYTLDIRVRGQNLEPVVTMMISPWNDTAVDGSISGTYFTADISAIEFDGNGNAVVRFCTDARALYIDWSGVKDHINRSLIPSGVEVISDEKGRILLDRQHCGSFGFKRDLSVEDAGYAAGNICLTAGNITTCLPILSNRLYDAHYIVGDSLMRSGDRFTHAVVEEGTPWLQLSKNRLYKPSEMLGSCTESTAVPLFLHADENLTGSLRTGMVSMIRSDGTEQKLKVAQLPALFVGKFGTASTGQHDIIYDMGLYTEQIPEDRLLQYKTVNDADIPDSSIYSGIRYVSYILDPSKYIDDYKTALYPAGNYCAYKNRDKNGNGILEAGETDWYLPAQAQLMGMWISFNGYGNEPTATFPTNIYWSASNNRDYANEAQYVNFSYGNAGHYFRTQRYSVRCVRNKDTADNTMITTEGTPPDDYPVIDFKKGMPEGSFSTDTKDTAVGHETSGVSKTVYGKLRIARKDMEHVSGDRSYDDAVADCKAIYSENGVSGWRLPTQREMQAIWIFQEEIKTKCSPFEYLSDSYYWTVTVSSLYPANAWTVYGIKNTSGGGNSPQQLKTEKLRVRCVKEL